MRSSDTIAELAGALAKAQVTLQNPPKSLIAYLEPGQDGSPGQAYRYAPLSAGLDIVRKGLGQHGIAVMQTTELDHGTDTLMLTTTLAHSSGEWMASSWPVCNRPEMAHPKLMGAALTYARRYSLFALVGLAGEDDLDAPELTSGHPPADSVSGRPTTPRLAISPLAHLNRAPIREARLRTNTPLRAGHDGISTSPPLLPATGLADLVSGLEQVDSPDALLRWSVAALPACNRLEATDQTAVAAALVQRAKAVGADPNLLLALTPTRTRKPRRPRAAIQELAPASTEAANVP